MWCVIYSLKYSNQIQDNISWLSSHISYNTFTLSTSLVNSSIQHYNTATQRNIVKHKYKPLHHIYKDIQLGTHTHSYREIYTQINNQTHTIATFMFSPLLKHVKNTQRRKRPWSSLRLDSYLTYLTISLLFKKNLVLE